MPSILGNTIADDSQPPDITIQPQGNPPNLGTPQTATPTLAPQPSRLLAILGAVAKVGTNALASIPEQGRPSFINGASAGARGAQAFEANQQAIKFKTF